MAAARPAAQAGNRHGMVGQSAPMQALYRAIDRVAPASGPVLITGESGAGKELVAEAIHAASARADGPFVAINCAGIPAELLESELFGFLAGAFTGARQDRRGLLAEAAGGTVLLDEIADMPPQMQAKLLRILENGRVRRLGSNRELQLDLRILAATHRDLQQEITAGRFREDLFFRLETFHVQVPPLRERAGDLARLVTYFLAAQRNAGGAPLSGLEDSAWRILEAYPFPGNVRELANVLEHAAAFCSGTHIGAAELPARLRRQAAAPAPGGPWPTEQSQLPTLAELERRYIAHVLRRVNGNKRQAAALLGIGRRTLYRRLEQPDETG